VIRWYAGLQLAMVAAHSLMAGLVLSAMAAEGWINWGRDGLLLAIVPILAWAAAYWWIERE